MPDIVILDLLTPHINAFQLLDAIRENPDWAKIPVVVMTAKILSAEELVTLNNQVRTVIQKSGITHEKAYGAIGRTVETYEQEGTRP